MFLLSEWWQVSLLTPMVSSSLIFWVYSFWSYLGSLLLWCSLWYDVLFCLPYILFCFVSPQCGFWMILIDSSFCAVHTVDRKIKTGGHQHCCQILFCSGVDPFWDNCCVYLGSQPARSPKSQRSRPKRRAWLRWIGTMSCNRIISSSISINISVSDYLSQQMQTERRLETQHWGWSVSCRLQQECRFPWMRRLFRSQNCNFCWKGQLVFIGWFAYGWFPLSLLWLRNVHQEWDIKSILELQRSLLLWHAPD